MPTKPKKKRFHRDLTVEERTDPYAKQKLDLVLATFAQHHFVSGKFMEALLPQFAGRSVRDYIRYHFDMGHIVKMRSLSFNHSHIYEVTDSGLRYLTKKAPAATNLIRQKGVTLPKNYFHSLMICNVTQNITIGANKSGDRVRYISEILTLLNSPLPRPFSLPYHISFTFPKGKKDTIKGHANPDNAVNIVYAKNNASRLILIEAERECPPYRETLHNGSGLRKVLAYEDICHRYPNGKRTIEQLGKGNCHVLFVYPSWEEALAARDRIADALKGRIDRSKRYLFGVQPTYDNPDTDPKPDTSIYDKPLLRIGEPDICLKDLCDE